MGAIAGVWHLDGREADPAALSAMGARLEHRSDDGIHIWREGPAALISGLNRVTPESIAGAETQPVKHVSGATLVFDGRLDNRSEILAALPSSFDPNAPDSQMIAELCARDGDAAATKLTGDFAFAWFDPGTQQLLLVRDQVGMRPLFFYRSRDLVVFASEVKAILAHPDVPAAPDEKELASYVMKGSPRAGTRTLFRGIDRVMPSHVIRIGLGGAASRMYWDFDRTAKVRMSSFEEYAEGLNHYFDQSVRRRLRSGPPVAVSLSGGLDSTSIFCLAETARRDHPNATPRIVPITFSSRDGTVADEFRYIGDIESMYGIDVLAVPPSTVKPTANVEEVVWMAEVPGTETFWDCMGEVHGRVAQEGARVLISGHLGDQFLFDRAYLVDLFDQLKWGRILHDLREYPRWNLEGDTSPLQHEFLYRLVRDHLPLALLPAARQFRVRSRKPLWDRPWYTEWFRQLGSGPITGEPLVRWQFASAHAHSIYGQARGASAVLAFEACDRAWAAAGLELAFPYADRDFISYLMAIPGEMLSYGGVPRGIMREAMKGVIPESIRTRRWKASFGPMIDRAVDDDRSDLLAAASRFSEVIRRGYVDEYALKEEISAVEKADSGEVFEKEDAGDWTLAGLNGTLALEAWISAFFEETAAPVSQLGR